MFYDFEKYARAAISKHFPEIEQEEIKDKYTKLLHKADSAIRDIVKNIFDESADDFMREAWGKITHAIIYDMQQVIGLKQCDYLDSHNIRDIRHAILKNNKEEIYNDVLKDKDENIKDLKQQLKYVEKENQQLKEQLYGK